MEYSECGWVCVYLVQGRMSGEECLGVCVYLVQGRMSGCVCVPGTGKNVWVCVCTWYREECLCVCVYLVQGRMSGCVCVPGTGKNVWVCVCTWYREECLGVCVPGTGKNVWVYPQTSCFTNINHTCSSLTCIGCGLSLLFVCPCGGLEVICHDIPLFVNAKF
uniref:Uncharacterized protein n=1 Tax=Esox lucius TaxID=8010 RepID=A0AAY5K9A9_ESOLU